MVYFSWTAYLHTLAPSHTPTHIKSTHYNMTSRPPTPKCSRSDVAAILVAMSRTPPQATGLDRRALEKSLVASSTPSDAPGVAKISNSDDKDTNMQAHSVHYESGVSKDCVQSLSRGKLHARVSSPTTPTTLTIPCSNPWATLTNDGIEASRPVSTPVDRPSFTTDKDERTRTSPIAGSLSRPYHPTSVYDPTQMGSHAGLRSRLPLSIPPDMVDFFLGPRAPSIDTGVAHPLAPVSMNSQASRWSYEDKLMPRHHNSTKSIPKRTSPPNSKTQARADVTDLPEEHAHPARMQTVPSPSAPPAYMADPRTVPDGHIAVGSDLSEDTRVRRRMRIFTGLRKHTVSPPMDSGATRQRDGFGPKEIGITDFRYRTIKVIQMPARDDVLPDQDPPEPTPESLPYSDEIDFQTSMLLYWLDEKALTYTESARRFRAMFPGETATDDTVRKKHHAALIRLAKKYGLKPEGEIEEPGKSVARRGQQAGHKYNTIGGKVVYAAGAGPDVAGTVRQKRISEPTADRGMLKAYICVWKDTSDVSFEEIQQRLANEYGWNIGANTVQKLYYKERARVYDTYDYKGNGAEKKQGTEESVETTAGEDVEDAVVQAEDSIVVTTESAG